MADERIEELSEPAAWALYNSFSAERRLVVGGELAVRDGDTVRILRIKPEVKEVKQ